MTEPTRLPFLMRSLVAASALCACCLAVEAPDDALKKLAADEFKVRESAQAQILEWALDHQNDARSLLFRHHRQTTDPEVQFRCMQILEALAKDDFATQGKGFIGIQMRDEMVEVPGREGPQAAIRITLVLPGLAAEKAGLNVGDLLLGINGKTWPSPATEAMRDQVMGMKPKTKISVQVLRNEKVENVEVTLVKRPLTADRPMTQRMAEEAEQRLWEQFFEEWKQAHDPGV